MSVRILFRCKRRLFPGFGDLFKNDWLFPRFAYHSVYPLIVPILFVPDGRSRVLLLLSVGLATALMGEVVLIRKAEEEPILLVWLSAKTLFLWQV